MKDKKFIIILLIAVIILSMPYFLRILSGNPTFIGDSYYHTRIAKIIDSKSVSYADNLVHGGRTYFLNPYHVLLSFFSGFLGMELTARLLPLFLGLLSLSLFYFILRRYMVKDRFLITVFLIISPIFAYTFTVLNEHSLAIFLILLGNSLILLKKKWFLALAVLIFALLPFISFFSVIFNVILLLNQGIMDKKNSKNIFTALLFLVLFSIISFSVFNLDIEKSIAKLGVEEFISDFGGLLGFSIFILVLFVLGLAYLWNKKYITIYLSLIILLAAVFYFGSYVNQYLCFLVVIFAGLTFNRLLRRKWSLTAIKNFTLIVLICGLIFSPLSYIKILSDYPPDHKIVYSLDFLRESSNEGDIIFSHYNNGFLIESIAERPVLLDGLLNDIPFAEEKLQESSEIFYSSNLIDTKQLLEKYSIE
ncbi:unnamed protein product, partial [marine sediment metagenome]